jgi:hypothetical protein
VARVGRRLFCVTAYDGRQVAMYEGWYQSHVIGRHPEVGDLSDPIGEIQRALQAAVEIKTTGHSTNPTYVGPCIGKGFYSAYCLHVAVGFRQAEGVVLSVQLKLA